MLALRPRGRVVTTAAPPGIGVVETVELVNYTKQVPASHVVRAAAVHLQQESSVIIRKCMTETSLESSDS